MNGHKNVHVEIITKKKKLKIQKIVKNLVIGIIGNIVKCVRGGGTCGLYGGAIDKSGFCRIRKCNYCNKQGCSVCVPAESIGAVLECNPPKLRNAVYKCKTCLEKSKGKGNKKSKK